MICLVCFLALSELVVWREGSSQVCSVGFLFRRGMGEPGMFRAGSVPRCRGDLVRYVPGVFRYSGESVRAGWGIADAGRTIICCHIPDVLGRRVGR